MLRKTAGDYIAASMDSIMESEDFKKIFRTNEKMIKSAWQDSADADDMADAKMKHTCDATCAEDCAYAQDEYCADDDEEGDEDDEAVALFEAARELQLKDNPYEEEKSRLLAQEYSGVKLNEGWQERLDEEIDKYWDILELERIEALNQLKSLWNKASREKRKQICNKISNKGYGASEYVEEMIEEMLGIHSRNAKKSMALNAAVDVLLSVSEYCDRVGLEKTAGLGIYLADILVSEAKAKSSKKSSKKSGKDSEKLFGKKMVSKKPVDKKPAMSSKKKPVKSSEPKPKKKVVKSS